MKYFILIILSFFGLSLKADEVILSLKDEWYKSKMRDTTSAYPMQIAYIDSILSHTDKKDALRLYIGKGDILFNMGKYREALNTFEKGMPEIPSDSLKMKYYVRWMCSICHFSISEFEPALNMAYSLLEENKPDSLRHFDFYAYTVLADFYLFIRNNELARKYIDKSIDLLDQLPPTSLLPEDEKKRLKSVVKMSSAECYINNREYDNALHELKEFDHQTAAAINKSSHLYILGRISEEKGDTAMAEDYYRSSLKINAQNLNLSFPFIHFMRLLLLQNRIDEARQLNEDYGEIVPRIMSSPLERYHLENMRLYYKLTGEKDKEMYVLEKIGECGDTLLERSLSAMRGIGEIFEQRAKERELAELSNEDKKKGVIIAILCGLVLALSCVGFWLHHKKRLSQKEADHMTDTMERLDKEHREDVKLTMESLDERNREVTSMTMYLARLNNAFDKIKKLSERDIPDMKEKERLAKINEVLKELSREENAWKMFQTYFEQVNQKFYDKLHKVCPSLTNAEIKMCAYILLNQTSKETATLTNRSVRTVDTIKHNLRKKLNITGPTEVYMRKLSSASDEELEEFIQSVNIRNDSE